MRCRPKQTAVNTQPDTLSDSQRTREGVISALISYSLWGCFPVYFKLVATVPPTEILVHRIIWAVPFGLVIVLARRQWPEVVRALRTPRTLAPLAAGALLLAVNWLVYVWAVQNDMILQGSLGYYINPLMLVIVGVLLFGERLRTLQSVAVLLAGIGVAVLTFSGGQFPVVALTLATSFTIYGSIRRHVDIGGMPGLFIETLVLLPAAMAYLAWLASQGDAVFTAGDSGASAMLMLAGPLTVMPLLMFALAARRLRLSTIGVMQFITPTLQFVVALAYGEALTGAHIVCFSLIWIAVFLFSGDAWRHSRSSIAR